jgi:hypothetical protein
MASAFAMIIDAINIRLDNTEIDSLIGNRALHSYPIFCEGC